MMLNHSTNPKKNFLLKNRRIPYLGTMVTFAILSVALAGLAIYFLQKSELQTRFSAHYTDPGFRSVKLGNSYQQAIDDAGLPLAISVEETSPVHIRLINGTDVEGTIQQWKTGVAVLPPRVYFLYSLPAASSGYEDRSLFLENGVVKDKISAIHWD
jgi:hypothetical protein